MTDPGSQSPLSRDTDRWLEPGKVNIQIIYLLYLVGFAIGITALVGIVLAYVNRDKAEAWARTHYDWAIRTFWIALLFGVISALLATVLIGVLGFLATAVWIVVRCVIGLQKAAREEPIADPESWWV